MSEMARISAQKDPVKREDFTRSTPKAPLHNKSVSSASRIIRCQQTTGNHAVQRMLKCDRLSARLQGNLPNGIYEPEANRVVERGTQTPEQTSTIPYESLLLSPRLSNNCSSCKDDDKKKNLRMIESLSLSSNPAKSISRRLEDTNNLKPIPTNGAATIQCDGSGGWEINYGSYENAICGIKGCTAIHENSHISDWKAKWPTGCQGRAKGYLPKGDPPYDNPLMTVEEYNIFLKASECKAYTASLACSQSLPKTQGCETEVNGYIALSSQGKLTWC